jgi:hypothetical protein
VLWKCRNAFKTIVRASGESSAAISFPSSLRKLPTVFQNAAGGGENKQRPRLASHLEKFATVGHRRQHPRRVRYPENPYSCPFVVKR